MRTIPVAALLLLTAACGRDIPGSGGDTSPRLLLVDPPAIDAYAGLEVKIDARLQQEDGTLSTVNGSPELSLASSNRAAFTITNAGVGRAIAPGASTIDARYQELAATAAVRVHEGVPLRLRVEPAAKQLVRGEVVRLRALLELTSGDAVDVTLAALGTTYLSTDAAIAVVDNNGAVTAIKDGSTTIRVSHANLEAMAVIDVVPAGDEFVSITLSPAMLTLPAGESSRMILQGTRASGDVEQIGLPNTAVVLSVANAVVASVGADGTVTARASGNTVVTAKMGDLSDSSNIVVLPTGDRVVRLEVSPNPLDMTPGDTRQLRVIATFESGATADVTSGAGTVYEPPIAGNIDVDNNGFVRALFEGTTTMVVSLDGVSVLVQVRVGPAQLIGIQILPETMQLPVGTIRMFEVIGSYSDGTVNFVNDPNLLVFSIAPRVADVFSPFTVTALEPGFTTIQASLDGFLAFMDVEVTSSQLVALSISTNTSIFTGDIAPFAVIGHFADGSAADMTFDPNIFVFADDPAVLSVMTPLLVGVSVGTTFLNATHSSGVQTSLFIRVIPPGLSITSIEIVAPASIAETSIEPFNVIAHWSDGSQSDLTFDPTLGLLSSDVGTLIVAPGTLIGVNEGIAEVTAAYQQHSDTARIEVTRVADPIVALTWVPLQLDVDVNATEVARLWAIDINGIQFDVTNDPQASYLWSGPFDVNVNALGVQISGLSNGNGEVVGTYQTLQAILPVHVGTAPDLVGIRVDPESVTVLVNGTASPDFFAVFSDGTEVAIIPQLFSLDPSIAEALPGASIRGISVGSTSMIATYGAFTASIQVQVTNQRPPQIFSINPEAVLVGSAGLTATLNGARFAGGDIVVIDGTPLPTTVLSANSMTVQIPASFFAASGVLTVRIDGVNGLSNTVTITVGAPPIVISWAPNAILPGHTLVVTVLGTNLTGLSASSLDFVISVIEETPSGTLVRLTITTAPNVPPGLHSITLSNEFGSDSLSIDVINAGGLMDLVVAANQTVTLSGTNAYNNVTVQTGGRIVATGTGPLVLLATNSITIRGTIDVSGSNGALGFSTRARGGNAGPGGGGGGAGGDGDAVGNGGGGTGSPGGGDSGNGTGSGTAAGDGGGDGGGSGAAAQCGAGGGGGALAGNGGSGGGEMGVGLGGAGGSSGGQGSTFEAGTGGGGATTCSNGSGGGGGGGGGALILQVSTGGTITIDGLIRANGGRGGDGINGSGGGGGGSGGRIEMRAESGTILINDTLSVRGGAGGETDTGHGGGGGGGGVIILDAAPNGSVTAALGFLDVTAGAQGDADTGNDGEAGADGNFSIAQ